MNRLNIDGIEYYKCSNCGSWTSGFCRCGDESKSKAVLKLLNICRKKYSVPIFVTPFHNSQQELKKHMNLPFSVFSQNVPRVGRTWDEVRPADFYSSFTSSENLGGKDGKN